ncbi:Uncharacterised protein [Chlamydia trachomatis]|nr:Uncharacterised protein [Chlamydia trachomatis]
MSLFGPESVVSARSAAASSSWADTPAGIVGSFGLGETYSSVEA